MVDIHQTSEHRIILGDSLKDGSSSQHMSVKYNWIPKNGFNHSSGTIKGTKNDLTLSYQDDDSKYEYTGWVSEQPEDVPHLALFYDKEQSAYVLERLAASMNVNIKAGTNLSSDYIKRHAQLPRSQSEQEGNSTRNDVFDNGEDDDPDPSNPFDYRNFLEEAKEATEKQSSRTPMPEGRTPMSGLSSPLTTGGHPFSSTTPQFGPIEIKSSSHGAKEEYPDRRRRKTATNTKSAAAASRKAQSTARPKAEAHPKQPQALSQEKVVDSDSDSDASADVSDHRPPAKKPTETHHRNVSSTSAAQSPRIVVEDDGGLEIDTGSPPPETRKRNYRIDPEAFRSQTGTPGPRLSRSTQRSRSGFDQRPISRDAYTNNDHEIDIDMHDADADADADEAAKYLQSASSSDDDDEDMPDNNAPGDADVDELILNGPDPGAKSPSASPSPVHAPTPRPKRRQSSTVKIRRPKAPSPPALAASNSAIEEADLEAELQAAFERSMQEEGDEDGGGGGGGVGLGIGGGGGGAGAGAGAGVDEDEEISEEE